MRLDWHIRKKRCGRYEKEGCDWLFGRDCDDRMRGGILRLQRGRRRAYAHCVASRGVAATCTEDGMPEYWSCSECGKAFSDAECTEELSVVSPIPALGHNMAAISYRAATCTEDGVTAHYECGRCGLYFADAEGSETIGADETVIPATGHSWGVWTEDVAPTKESAGTLVRTCANCSDEDEMQLPVLDEYDRHDYSWQAVAPSCTSDGWERFSLTVENADGTDRTVAGHRDIGFFRDGADVRAYSGERAGD